MRGQRREGRTPSVEPEQRSGGHTAVIFYPLILLKSLLYSVEKDSRPLLGALLAWRLVIVIGRLLGRR